MKKIIIGLAVLSLVLLVGCKDNDADVPQLIKADNISNMSVYFGISTEIPKCLLLVHDSKWNRSICMTGKGIEFCHETDCWFIEGEYYKGNYSKLVDAQFII